MTSRAILWMGLMHPQAFYGTPSYALYIAETARKEGIDPRTLGVKRMFFSGEPGASIPGVKDRIEEAVAGLHSARYVHFPARRTGLRVRSQFSPSYGRPTR